MSLWWKKIRDFWPLSAPGRIFSVKNQDFGNLFRHSGDDCAARKTGEDCHNIVYAILYFLEKDREGNLKIRDWLVVKAGLDSGEILPLPEPWADPRRWFQWDWSVVQVSLDGGFMSPLPTRVLDYAKLQNSFDGGFLLAAIFTAPGIDVDRLLTNVSVDGGEYQLRVVQTSADLDRLAIGNSFDSGVYFLVIVSAAAEADRCFTQNQFDSGTYSFVIGESDTVLDRCAVSLALDGGSYV